MINDLKHIKSTILQFMKTKIVRNDFSYGMIHFLFPNGIYKKTVILKDTFSPLLFWNNALKCYLVLSLSYHSILEKIISVNFLILK